MCGLSSIPTQFSDPSVLLKPGPLGGLQSLGQNTGVGG